MKEFFKVGMVMTDLTVCIPIYNVESYLAQCVESVLRQTYRDIHVILVDDGSIDDSGRICDEIAQRDKRVMVIHKKNEGPIAARYAGVKAASTKYITFVDADDWLDADMYKDLMKVMKQTGCEVITSGKKSYFTQYNIRSSHDQFKEGFYTANQIQSAIVPYMIGNKTYCLDPSLAIKIFLREKVLYQYENLLGKVFHYGEDMAIVYPLIMQSQSVFIIHKAYYYHRQRKQNEVAGYIVDKDFFAKLLCLYQYLIDISDKNPVRVELRKQLDLWYIRSVKLKNRCYLEREFSIKWLFPFGKVRQGSKIILYGAGKVGKGFFKQIEKTQYCNIVAWVDSRAEDIQQNDCAVKPPDCIEVKVYDVVVVAVNDRSIRKEIVENLVSKYAVKRDEIIWDWAEMF